MNLRKSCELTPKLPTEVQVVGSASSPPGHGKRPSRVVREAAERQREGVEESTIAEERWAMGDFLMGIQGNEQVVKPTMRGGGSFTKREAAVRVIWG